MGAFLGVAILVAFIAVYMQYQKLLRKGMRQRQITTRLSPAELRDAFQSAVATMGWKYVEHDGQLVARQGVLGGGLVRQEITCRVSPGVGGKTVAVIAPSKVTKKVLGGYNQAHTIRMRLNRFVAEVCRRDPEARVVA